MKPSPEFLEALKQSEFQFRENVRNNYKEGTVLLVDTNFDTRNVHLSVNKVQVIENILGKVDDICWNAEEYFVVNCFENIHDYYFTNNFIFPKTTVKPGDTVYVVTADDGDCYGQFVLGVFSEKPNNDEILEKYKEYLKYVDSLEYSDDENEEDYCEAFYVNSIFEVVVE